MRPQRRRSGEGWAAWLLLAVALHALIALLPRAERPAPSMPPPAEAAPLSVELEISEPERAPWRPDSDAAVAVAPTPPPRGAGALRGPLRAASPAPKVGDPLAPVPVLEAEVAETSDPAPLSLSQLGIGEENPFVGRREQPRPTPRELGRQRFERAMAADIARAEQAVGLGPEGPVLTQLEVATRSGNPSPNSRALFECTTDAGGKLLSVQLVESSSDATPWRRIARNAHRALGSTRLRVPKSGYGAVFRIRVVSRVQLPSGADPGLAVNILGIPLQRGRGPRSTRIDILNLKPELSEAEIPLASGQTLHVPTLKMGNVFSLMGDPVDIGAPEQRVVRAHLESLTVTARKADLP